MTPFQSKAISLPTGTSVQSMRPSAWLCQQLEGVEMVLIAARNRLMGALDRELAEVRTLKKVATVGTGSTNAPMLKIAEAQRSDAPSTDMAEHAPLPENVVPLSREAFTASGPVPSEVSLDPELERATIDELNAALAAAFSQMSAH